MKFFYSICFLSINLLVQQFMSSKVLSCNTVSKVDSISYLYYRGIAFILTSNGYYYVIREEEVHKEDIKQFDVWDRIPHLDDCCDSALIKDLNDCQNDSESEHSIIFMKQISSGQTNYISLNISSLLDDKRYLWSQPKQISTELLLSELQTIDYSKPIDAIFNTDNTGEIFFIQDEFYTGIEFHESCPQHKNQIKVYERRRLSELNVSGSIDSSYYEPNHETNPILYLTNYDKMLYFRLEIDAINSKEGHLISLNTTIEDISSHPIFSKICAPDTNQYNSSHLSSKEPMDGMTSKEWTPFCYGSHLSLFSIFIFLLMN